MLISKFGICVCLWHGHKIATLTSEMHWRYFYFFGNHKKFQKFSATFHLISWNLRCLNLIIYLNSKIYVATAPVSDNSRWCVSKSHYHYWFSHQIKMSNDRSEVIYFVCVLFFRFERKRYPYNEMDGRSERESIILRKRLKWISV